MATHRSAPNPSSSRRKPTGVYFDLPPLDRQGNRSKSLGRHRPSADFFEAPVPNRRNKSTGTRRAGVTDTGRHAEFHPPPVVERTAPEISYEDFEVSDDDSLFSESDSVSGFPSNTSSISELDIETINEKSINNKIEASVNATTLEDSTTQEVHNFEFSRFYEEVNEVPEVARNSYTNPCQLQHHPRLSRDLDGCE